MNTWEMGLDLWPYRVLPEQVVCTATYLGQPLGKGRPRLLAPGRVVTPSETRRYERALRNVLTAAVYPHLPEGDGRYALRCLFYRGDRRRIDLDNCLKSVADAANEVVWVDDSQLVEVHAMLLRDEERPRAEILIYRVDRSPQPLPRITPP